MVSHTVEPPLSDQPKCQVKVVAYESLDHFPHLNMTTAETFEKYSSLWEISVSCTSQKYDDVTTPFFYYPFFAPLFVNWSLTGG